MEFIAFLSEDPVMAWLAFLALIIIIVPALSVVWRKMSGSNLIDNAIPAKAAKPAKPPHFGNQTELVIVLAGLLLILVFVAWVRAALFG